MSSPILKILRPAAYAEFSAIDLIQFHIIYTRYLQFNAQMERGIQLTLNFVTKNNLYVAI